MPLSTNIRLRMIGELNPILLDSLNSALHSSFLGLIAREDHQLATELHDSQSNRPYTLSPLGIEKIEKESLVSFRLTLLDDDIWEIINRSLTSSHHVRLGNTDFELIEAASPQRLTYKELIQIEPIPRSFAFRFVSPTVFRKQGREYTLPEPDMIFRSLYGRWNTFAPQQIMIDHDWLTWAGNSIEVVRGKFAIETKRYSNYSMKGFIGTFVYQARSRNTPKSEISEFQIANTLANYARFCGIGSRTTQGFGQTIRLEKWMKAKFFISYSWKDESIANLISSLLQMSGFETWLDKKDILIGQPILDRLSEGIGTESDFVIILISKSSSSSEWCRHELRMAYQKEFASKRVVVLPIRIDDVEVPVELSTKKYFQLDSQSIASATSLVDEINDLLRLQFNQTSKK